MAGRERIRAVAFDLFHTLVDPEEFRPKEFLRADAVAGLLGVPSAEFRRYWGAGYRDRLVSLVPTVTDRVRQFCAARGLRPSDDVWPVISDILGRYQDLALRNPRRTIVEGLRRLKARGLALGLVSNCDEREMRSWGTSPLAPLFDATIFSCEVGVPKPEKEAYLALVPRWGGVPLGEALFVGDGSDEELAGARRAGFVKVVFDSEFVGRNGLRSDEANERLRAEAGGSVAALGEVESLLGPEAPGSR